MADPATLAVLGSIAEYAEYVGTIISAIKTARAVLGQPDKQQDDSTKKILEAIAQAAASIKDEIHLALLKEHIGAVEDATTYWIDAWLYVVRVGITFDNLDPNGSYKLHGTEERMSGKLDNVSRALTHFHQNRGTLPPTPEMLQVLLSSYSLYLSMETIWTTFTWVRSLHSGDPTPPKELLDHTARLDQGRETIEAWLTSYKQFRLSQIQIRVQRGGLVVDEKSSTLIYEWFIEVQQDLGGDTIVGKLKPDSSLAYIAASKDAPGPDRYEPRVVAHLQGEWETSENEGKAVAIVFENWAGVKKQVGLLLRPA